MRRRDVPEIEDQPWCPGWLRSAMTGYLQQAIRLSRPYQGAASAIADLLRQAGTHEVVDLCSGSGGPWPDLQGAVSAQLGRDVRVVLTDLHPDRAAAARETPGLVHHPEPVSALAVPSNFRGVRTMFTALHHFGPDEMGAILGAAQRERIGFAAFEATHRSLKGLLVTLLVPVLVLLLIPRVRPLRWRTLVFTYLVPIIPLATWWDGLASTLRTYRASEIEAITRQLSDDTYEWTVTERHFDGLPMPVLQVLGRPV